MSSKRYHLWKHCTRSGEILKVSSVSEERPFEKGPPKKEYSLTLFRVALFLGPKVVILGTQSPKYLQDKGITNQFPFVYTIAKCLFNRSLLATSNCASFILKTINTGNIDWEIHGFSAQTPWANNQEWGKEPTWPPQIFKYNFDFKICLISSEE